MGIDTRALVRAIIAVVALAAPSQARTPTPTDGPSPTASATGTITMTPTATGTRPPPPPEARIQPNPARSGQTVTLTGTNVGAFSDVHWTQVDGEVALEIAAADQPVATFVVPAVAGLTVVRVRISSFSGANEYDVTLLPQDAVLLEVGRIRAPTYSSATLTIGLHPAGLSVGALRHELIFAPAAVVAARSDGPPDCTPGQGLDVDAATFAFTPDGCGSGEPCRGMRADIALRGAIVADQSELYRCRLALADSLDSCTQPLRCDAGEASDANGLPLTLACSEGGVVLDDMMAPAPTWMAPESAPTAPVVGDQVRVTFKVTGAGSFRRYSLDGAAPFLHVATVADGPPGSVVADLSADCPGLASLRLTVTGELRGGCAASLFFFERQNTSPPFNLFVRDRCSGDCDGDGTVRINELVTAVEIALGDASHYDCVSADRDGSATVTIDELQSAVDNALVACAASRP